MGLDSIGFNLSVAGIQPAIPNGASSQVRKQFAVESRVMYVYIYICFSCNWLMSPSSMGISRTNWLKVSIGPIGAYAREYPYRIPVANPGAMVDSLIYSPVL